MKRKLSFCLCLWVWAFALPLTVHSVDWITANQVTLAWGDVSTLEDGSAIPEGDVISYEVFTVPEEGNKETDRTLKGETLETSTNITLDPEGFFYLGVRAVRSKATERVSVSKIAWTDNPAVMVDGVATGVIFFRVPANPLNLDIN